MAKVNVSGGVVLNMKIFPLNLRFKGARSYLHGTDMYEAVVTKLSVPTVPAGRFRMKIARLATQQLDLHLGETGERPVKPERAVVDFSLEGTVGSVFGWLVESERAVVERYPYAEEEIEALAALEDTHIRMEGEPDATPIEIVVSMTRQLHGRQFPPGDRRWMFTGLDLKRLFEPGDKPGLGIVLGSTLGGRLTKSQIVVGNDPLGFIFFSLVSL